MGGLIQETVIDNLHAVNLLLHEIGHELLAQFGNLLKFGIVHQSLIRPCDGVVFSELLFCLFTYAIETYIAGSLLLCILFLEHRLHLLYYISIKGAAETTVGRDDHNSHSLLPSLLEQRHRIEAVGRAGEVLQDLVEFVGVRPQEEYDVGCH